MALLKNLDPLLSPDLLHALRGMGHGDEIAIVDANFPAASTARRLIRLDGIPATRALEAVLSVLPLDDFAECAAHCMEVVGDPHAEPEICRAFADILRREADQGARLGKIERFAFYDRVRAAFAVVATGETRLYGNIILAKGILRPPAEPGASA